MESADLGQHTSRRFNEDMERVTTRVLQMGGFVEQQLQRAVTALIEGNSALGEEVAILRREFGEDAGGSGPEPVRCQAKTRQDFSLDEVRRAFVLDRHAVDAHDTVDHLDLVARQSDYALDVISRGVLRQPKHHHIPALRKPVSGNASGKNRGR